MVPWQPQQASGRRGVSQLGGLGANQHRGVCIAVIESLVQASEMSGEQTIGGLQQHGSVGGLLAQAREH